MTSARSSRLTADGALFELHDVVAGHEEVEVLRGVSLAVRAGQIACIVGANSAGKSTPLRTVFGMVRPRAGHIRFGGEEIAHRAPTRRGEPRDGRLPARGPRVRDDIERDCS